MTVVDVGSWRFPRRQTVAVSRPYFQRVTAVVFAPRETSASATLLIADAQVQIPLLFGHPWWHRRDPPRAPRAHDLLPRTSRLVFAPSAGPAPPLPVSIFAEVPERPEPIPHLVLVHARRRVPVPHSRTALLDEARDLPVDRWRSLTPTRPGRTPQSCPERRRGTATRCPRVFRAFGANALGSPRHTPAVAARRGRRAGRLRAIVREVPLFDEGRPRADVFSRRVIERRIPSRERRRRRGWWWRFIFRAASCAAVALASEEFLETLAPPPVPAGATRRLARRRRRRRTPSRAPPAPRPADPSPITARRRPWTRGPSPRSRRDSGRHPVRHFVAPSSARKYSCAKISSGVARRRVEREHAKQQIATRVVAPRELTRETSRSTSNAAEVRAPTLARHRADVAPRGSADDVEKEVQPSLHPTLAPGRRVPHVHVAVAVAVAIAVRDTVRHPLGVRLAGIRLGYGIVVEAKERADGGCGVSACCCCR